MAVNLNELQTELLTDPNGYGYAPYVASGAMTTLANMLNTVRPAIQITKPTVLRTEILGSLDQAEYDALPAVRQTLWNTYTRADLDMVAAPGMRTQIEALFGGTGATVTALAEVWERDGSRAEQLWGTQVSWQDCAAALALPPPALTHVPNSYTPKLSLPWAAKATHIWALHPSNPLRADKGGLTLEIHTTGTGVPPSANPAPENTMEFHGGDMPNTSIYRTVGTFIWGDDPVTAGNQTPPMIGSMSCWVWFNSFANYVGVIGGYNENGTEYPLSAHILATAAGLIASNVNGFAIGPGVPTGAWVHLASTNNGSLQRLYINGAKVAEAANTSVAGGDTKFAIGVNGWPSTASRFSVNGRIRLVAVVQGAIWTDAEILAQFQNPYTYYEG